MKAQKRKKQTKKTLPTKRKHRGSVFDQKALEQIQLASKTDRPEKDFDKIRFTSPLGKSTTDKNTQPEKPGFRLVGAPEPEVEEQFTRFYKGKQ